MKIWAIEVEEGHAVTTGEPARVVAADLEGTFKVASLHVVPANNAAGWEARVELEVPMDAEGEHCTYPEVGLSEVEWA